MQYSPSPAHSHATALIKPPLLELHAMAQSFAPQCFFPEASLPLSPPEAPVGVEAGTATASSVDGARGAEKALDGQR